MKKKLRILLVEDSPADAELLRMELQSQHINYNELLVQTEKDYVKAIEIFKPDIILSDFNLPGFDALKALSLLKQLNKDIPFILVTGTQSEEIAVKCIKEGADDYILKTSLIRLPTAVRHAIEAKESKDAYQKAEAEYKELVENIDEVIFSADVSGKLTYLSPVVKMLSGYDPSELTGYNYKRIIFKEDIQLFENFLNIATEKGNKILEFRGTAKSGELKWYKISSRPIYENSIVTGFRGIISDITSRKLFEIGLLKAKERAEELIEMKTSFMANISHELRTPMVGILGFSEMLESELTTPNIDIHELSNMATMIRASGKRFLDTLNLILEFSVLERGGEGLRLDWFNFAETAKFVYRMHQPAAAKKNIQFEIDLPKTSIMVRLDEKFCRSILNNLISNALKFTGDNGIVSVTVETHEIYSTKWVVLVVTDNGIGIPKEKTSTIFEEFRQLSSGYTRNFDGTGLGLTITEKYVKKLNGHISVESEVGVGSSFIVRLPLNYKSDDTNNEKESEAEIDPSIKILLIDDDYNAANVFRNYLEGIKTSHVGKENLLFTDDTMYDLLLLNINFEGYLNGLNVLKNIRRMPAYFNTPVIAVLSRDLLQDRDYFINQGFNDSISLPIDKSDFLNIVSKNLSANN